jgi:hypothetical protein
MTDGRVYSTMYHITPACVYFYTVSDLNIESGRQCTKLLNYTKSVLTWGVMVNNITVISWWSDSLVEETEAPGENHRPVVSHSQALSYNLVLSTHGLIGIQTRNVRGECIDCIGSCKSHYHTITMNLAV